MFRNPLLLIALALTIAVSVWGIIDTQGLAAFAAQEVKILFRSRGWFVMLTASVMLIASFWLALSPYGRIKLGRDDDEPEFSTGSWMTMMFAAGMGVGLLFYGAAEPITHYLFLSKELEPQQAARAAFFITQFHWGLHAWAIYGLTALVIAYFGFRRHSPQLMGAPIRSIFGKRRWSRPVSWIVDLISIYAIAIGLGGSVAMGVFQIQDGVATLLNMDGPGFELTLIIFIILCIAYMLPLMTDLSRGMALLSNTAITIAISLMVYLLLAGPTYFMMNGLVESIGEYLFQVIPHGFRTYAFYGEQVGDWFGDWTLNYMVWWLAWSPFVGVFIARISRGRTIREFILGVMLAPTAFSIFWFAVFGGLGFFKAQEGLFDPSVAVHNINQTTFMLLKTLPLSHLTIAATIAAAFLFVETRNPP